MPPDFVHNNDENDIETFECNDCGVEVEVGDEMQDPEGNTICEPCSDNNYINCESCGDLVANENSYYADCDGMYRCEDCYDDEIRRCEHCDTDMPDSDAYYTSNDECVCEHCYNEDQANNRPEWEVLSNDFVKENDDFVSPLNSGYDEDTFDIIKSKRYVGLEIETNFDSTAWDNEPSSTDIQEELARMFHSDQRMSPDLSVVYDGSITDDSHPYGYEIVMRPRRGDILLKDTQTVCNTLKNSLDAYVSRKCGLHLHIDVRDYDYIHFTVLSMMTKLIEPHVYSWCPPSRATSQWCRKVSQRLSSFKYVEGRDDFIDVWYDNGYYSNEKYNEKRYHGLNLHCHFQANQGLEIRYHGGTLSPDKIKHWTIFWTNVVDVCYEIGNKVRDELVDKPYSQRDLRHTSIFKSILGCEKMYTKINRLANTYSDYSESTDIEQYYKDSELLRRYMKLPKKDKPYLVQPLVGHLYALAHNNRPHILGWSNMMRIFNIPKETQEFFAGRKQSFKDREDSHIRNLYADVVQVVEFNIATNLFEYTKSVGRYWATIDDASDRYFESHQMSYMYYGRGTNEQTIRRDIGVPSMDGNLEVP